MFLQHVGKWNVWNQKVKQCQSGTSTWLEVLTLTWQSDHMMQAKEVNKE